MTDAAPIFSSTTGNAVPQLTSRATFAFARICRSLRNSLTRLSSNHQLPRSVPEAVRQGLSNLNSYFTALIHASPQGIERPVLAAAQLLLHWSFCQLQQRATGQANAQLPQLLLTTSRNDELNEVVFALNQLMLATTTPEEASAVLHYLHNTEASCKEWRLSLPEGDRQLFLEFEQRFKACLEKMAFWQPRSTLLLPMVNRLAPYISVYLDFTLPGLATSPATFAPGQALNASPVIIGETGPDVELWFKSIINLPGEVALPPLLLRQGQMVCLRIPKCPTGMVHPANNQTADFDIAGAGIDGNLATLVCVNNHKGLDIEIKRDFNSATTGYPSALYRHPLQIEGINESVNDGICPTSPSTSPNAPTVRTEQFADARTLRVKMNNAAPGWNLFPLVGAQDNLNGPDEPQDLDAFGPMAEYDDWPFYDYDDTTTFTALLSTSRPPAEQIDYEVNLFERNKRQFFPLTFTLPFPFPRKSTTTSASAATPDTMAQLFGTAEHDKPKGSCRIRQPVLIARDLDDMLARAHQWLSQMPVTYFDDRIHAYFIDQREASVTQHTPLEEVIIVCHKLVINSHHVCTFDENEAVKFARLLFMGSHFVENKELLHAWVLAPAGKQQIIDILIDNIDRQIPDPGKLVSATFNQIRAVIRPERTPFSSLGNILIDLQNGFKNNLLSSLINALDSFPALLERADVIEILQFIHLEYLKNHLPFFRLINKADISKENVISTDGVLLTVAAGIVENDARLNGINADKLKQYGMQALLRFSEEYLLTKFYRYDKLLEKSTHQLCYYLNHLAVEGRLLVHILYLNNKIHHALHSGREWAGVVKSDYYKLSEVEQQLCTLALEQIPAADQNFFLFASQEPQGLEIHFITSENASDTIKTRHFIGFTITSYFEHIRRCYFISEIPILNDFAAPLAYNVSDHFKNKNHYANWINNEGKNAFVARLSAQKPNQISQTTFFVSDKKSVSGANERENWQLYIQNLSQNIINLRFPNITAMSTPAPTTAETLLQYGGNIISQFIPIQSCKQVIDDILDKPNTGKKLLMTLEDAALCLYDASPEGEESKLVKSLASVARSIVGKIAESIREESRQNSAASESGSIELARLGEQIYIEDSQVRTYLANSTLFKADFRWMQNDNSLNIRQLPVNVEILDVHWNIITDQIYCRVNNTQSIKNYRLDQENALLLPTRHPVIPNELNNQELTINTDALLSHINNNTLHALKIATLEQDMGGPGALNKLNTTRLDQHMRIVQKYNMVFFKRQFNEIDFNRNNITDAFFNVMSAPAGWRPVRLWIKKENGDSIITEWKDEKNRIQFHQLSKFINIFRSWSSDPIDSTGTPIRTQRDGTTKSPYYTDMISPMMYGYVALNPYEDHQRKTAMHELIKQGNRLPEPPHFAEIACRKMMKELRHVLPVDFIRGKFPAATEFIDKFAKWETAAKINTGFKRFSRAVEIFHAMYPDETTFYPKASKFIKEYEELDRKLKTFHYRSRAFKDNLAVYYRNFPEREMKANSWLNKVLDKITPSDVDDEHKFFLKTKTKEELIEKYPLFFERLDKNIKELHAQARKVSDLFNNKSHPRLMSSILMEFTGKTFTEEEVNAFTADFRRLQNNILAITPERFRVFEDRYSKDGQLVAGCFKSEAEKLFFSPGEIAFTTTADKHKFIYTQKIPNDDIFKQIAIHESGHINNGLDLAYTTPEIYVESYNVMKKFSFHGIEQYGKALLSDRDHLIDYLMRDSEFLENFCDQLLRHTSEAHQRVKIGDFQSKYLGRNAVIYQNRYSDDAEKKRTELRSMVDIAYNNHRFLLYFLKQNADFMVSIWHRAAEYANEFFDPNNNIDQDAIAKFDLLKSIVFQAGTAIFDEINQGASGSGMGNSG